VIHEIASSTHLFCFDEFQVTDIGDALLMRRLFSGLFDAGVVMVATSNRAPEELYKNGIQRDIFLPFIDDLKDKCDIHDLASTIDYRRLKQVLIEGSIYSHPLNQETDHHMTYLFSALTEGLTPEPGGIDFNGRRLEVPLQAGGVSRFTFKDLCEGPLGAEDYLALAEEYHTVFVTDIPEMDRDDLEPIRRLILLIDTF